MFKNNNILRMIWIAWLNSKPTTNTNDVECRENILNKQFSWHFCYAQQRYNYWPVQSAIKVLRTKLHMNRKWIFAHWKNRNYILNKIEMRLLIWTSFDVFWEGGTIFHFSPKIECFFFLVSIIYLLLYLSELKKKEMHGSECSE